MILPFAFLLRRCAGPCLLVLGLAGCALEPLSFWTDTPKGELDLTSVPPPPVPLKPGHQAGLKVPYLRGYVRTPYTHPPRLVDVRGLRPGTLVVCPFTQKLFNVPADFVDAPAQSRSRSTVPAQSLPKLPAHEMPAPLPPAAAAAPRARELPYGIPVPGRPGFVLSPYADKSQLVDVTGLAAGMEVSCPYTGKLFRVPK